MEARPYQSEAADAVWDRLIVKDQPATMVVLPTGTGKTVLFGMLAQRYVVARQDRVLVLAHREELITQAAAELAGIMGRQPAIEMAEFRAISADTENLFGKHDLPRVVVASVATLTNPKRMQRFGPEEFGLIVQDEAHHATAPSFRRIYEYFNKAKLLGVTATPQRADKFCLGSIFNDVAYQMGICEAVEAGWLVPVEQRFVTVKEMDLEQVGTKGGELDSRLGHVLTGDKVLDQMVVATVERCGDEPTLVFTAPRSPDDEVSQGEIFADALNKIKPARAVFLSGETDPDTRRDELKRFETGERQYLVGCALFTEGFNCPKISRIVMARPTKSIIYYTQAIGRGTRTLRGVLTPEMDTPEKRKAAIAASAKPSVLVIDFVGNSGRHKLMSCFDIFAGEAPPEVIARAKEKANANDSLIPHTVADLLEESEAELKQEEKKSRELRRNRVRVNRVDLHEQDVNPYEYTDGGERRKKIDMKSAPMTGEQRRWLEEHGGVVESRWTASQAGAAIADIKRRWKLGLCSPKQEKVLKRNKLCTEAIPKEHARALIDYLVANNWQVYRLPFREELGIVKVQSGNYRLTINTPDGMTTRVGKEYCAPSEVRKIYEGLCSTNREPAVF